jgi:hypothetical protein
MPAVPRHHRHPLTSQRMPRVGDFYFCWKPAGVVPQYVTDFKNQLGLERHGGRVPAGLWAHMVQRLLALNAAIWHNWQIGAPVKRSLIAYDH